MKNNITKIISILFLLIVLLIVANRLYSHDRVLNNIYYGYYAVPNEQQFVILVFDVKSPHNVAIRANLGDIKINNVLPIKYKSNAVTINSQKGPIILNISNERMQLTCSSCDGKSFPKVFSMGVDHKPFPNSTVDSAFQEISKDSQSYGGVVN